MSTYTVMMQWLAARSFYGPRGYAAYGDYQNYAIPTLQLVCNHATAFGTVLQAGGHIGIVATTLAQCFANVITVEPADDNYAWLQENVAGIPNIETMYGALGDGASVKLVRAKYSTCHHAKGPGDIPCFRIDDIVLPRLDVLLLDLEGGELVALHHATETLRKHRPLVIAEEYARWMRRYDRQPGDVARFLATFGYHVVGCTDFDLAFLPDPEEKTI